MRERSSDMHRQCVANWTIKPRRSCENGSDRWRADTTVLISEMVRTVGGSTSQVARLPRGTAILPVLSHFFWRLLDGRAYPDVTGATPSLSPYRLQHTALTMRYSTASATGPITGPK